MAVSIQIQNMAGVCSSEMLVSTYNTKCRHNPEDNNLSHKIPHCSFKETNFGTLEFINETEFHKSSMTFLSEMPNR
jgi:hypothetical protein